MKAWIAAGAVACLTCVTFVTGSCASGGDAVDRHRLHEVALPDLSQVEESVQAQLRSRYASLQARQADRASASADLAMEYGEMGKLLMAAELRESAEASLLNAQALAPNDMRWPYYLGHLYRANGDIPHARAAFERAQRLAPDDVPTMTWIAESALDEGRPEEAEALLTKALSFQPRSAAAHYGLGRAALARKDYARAAQHLEQAFLLDNRASIIHYPLAMAYRGEGDDRRAGLHLQQRGAVPLAPDPLRKALDELLHSALTYEKNADAAGNRGDWASAADYLRKAVALAPTRASPRHKLGTALFYSGDRHGATDAFREAVRLSPAFAAARYALGVVYEEDGDHRQAIASFSAAIASEPVHVEARLGLADALRRSGALEPSLREYARILEIDPGLLKARFGYAATLIRLRRFGEARDRLTSDMDRYPSEPAFAQAAARLLAAAPDARLRDGPRALAIARALAERQVPTIELAETLAMALAESGQFTEAGRRQRQALDAARAGRRPAVGRLAANLERYEHDQPSRAPWQADEPIEYYSAARAPAGGPR
jgi:tetratricopeptide (TPR) repeat protein